VPLIEVKVIISPYKDSYSELSVLPMENVRRERVLSKLIRWKNKDCQGSDDWYKNGEITLSFGTDNNYNMQTINEILMGTKLVLYRIRLHPSRY
jgi:hypothetical protein